jgi:hypothetical protein
VISELTEWSQRLFRHCGRRNTYLVKTFTECELESHTESDTHRVYGWMFWLPYILAFVYVVPLFGCLVQSLPAYQKSTLRLSWEIASPP